MTGTSPDTPASAAPQLRIFISTGEVSGDLQGSLLIQALQRQAVAQGMALEILALGGDRMAEAGATLLGNTSGIGSVGILESLPFILPTLTTQHRAKQYLRAHPPDLVVLIDYMGPNLAIGSYLHRHHPQVPIVYYIAPQTWVWSSTPRSTRQIVNITKLLLAIFPAEAEYFRKFSAQVQWVGHPLIDRMKSAPSRAAARETLGIPADQQAIALLPASRRQELQYLLPVLFQSAQAIQAQLPQAHFWIPVSLPEFEPILAREIARYGLRATLLTQPTQAGSQLGPSSRAVTLEAIAAADLALTKSGTANLEIALLNVPQVVVYRVNPITYWIARHLLGFSIPFMSPANLVQMREIVPEFLQEQATPDNIVNQAMDLLLNPDRRQQTLADYEAMRAALGEPGVCDRAAQAILALND